jgi:sugar phosphate isomerase/epimerase
MGGFDDHLPLGKGSIDWAQVNELWEVLGKDIPVTLETGNPESTKESLCFLRKHHYFGLEGIGNEKF